MEPRNNNKSLIDDSVRSIRRENIFPSWEKIFLRINIYDAVALITSANQFKCIECFTKISISIFHSFHETFDSSLFLLKNIKSLVTFILAKKKRSMTNSWRKSNTECADKTLDTRYT